MKRILFYSINGLGLGHLRRNVLIYDALKNTFKENLHAIFVTSAERHDWLKSRKVPFYFFPSEAHCKYTWEIKTSNIPLCELITAPPVGLNESLLKCMLEVGKFSCVIADTYYPLILPRICSATGAQFIGVYDSDWCTILHENRVFHTLAGGGNILIANIPSKQYGTAKYNYCGIVLPIRDSSLEEQMARKYWRESNHIRIVCAQGGGGFTHKNSTFYRNRPSFSEKVFEALKIVAMEIPLEAAIFTGPFSPPTKETKIEGKIRLYKFEPHLSSLLASADCAILKAGYNLTAESISSHCPTIFIPTIEPTDDQRQNLHILTDKVDCRILEKYSIEHLVRILLNLLCDENKLLSMRKALKKISKRFSPNMIIHQIYEYI